MAEHNTLTGSSLHEPKNIDSAGTGDAGKVLTPSASVAGEGVLRNLVESEVDEKVAYLTLDYPDITVASDVYLPMPFAGTVTQVHSVIDSALATADTDLVCKVNGTGMTNGTITVAFTASAAGDVDTATPTALNTFVADDYLQVTTDAAGTGGTGATITFTVERS
jgi:hypothetical protein